jgi:UDP-2,3-diacylglucosamine pyrophosphatase LpxH
MVSSSPRGRARARFRSIFLSDVHLGSPRAQAELLLDFLAHHHAEYLFLVGDIADDADARPLAAWPETHRAVLEALRGMSREGTRVHYMTGNHDPRFVELWGAATALEVARDLEHTTADGRRLWIVHGDGFDEVVHRRRWLSRIGDALARGLEHACEGLERLFLARRGQLGRRMRERCKRWLGYTERFERSAVYAARERAVDGIICGHVHCAASRTIDGVYYGNGGDWVGSATALVEHVDGRMELLCWEPAA